MLMNKPGFRLVRCDALGRPTEPISDVAATFLDHARGAADLYARQGFYEPWVFYAAVWNKRAVGGGAFMGPPQNGRVEIAVFTLGPYQRQGFGTQTARRLMGIALDTDASLTVTGRCHDKDTASTRLLRRLGFRRSQPTKPPDGTSTWAKKAGRV